MHDCLSDSDVIALATGRLVSRDRHGIDAHLAGCARCRQRVEAARRNNDTIHADARVTTDRPHTPRDGDTSASALSSAPASITPAALNIPGYDIGRVINSGGQGVVYKATQHGTQRTVAIKVLPQQANSSERQKRRFEREVALAASLQHPNVVTIFHSGVSSGQYFFAMEYIRGQPLDEYLAAAHLDVRGKMELFARICAGVAHAHSRDVAHRDLKPGNILVDSQGEPHVLDFGLAKSPAAALLDREQRVTRSSQFLGTLAYSAPEQGSGDPDLPDRRTDVYALGVVLFEMLTGRMPYPLRDDLEGTLRVIRETPPRRPSEFEPGIERDLDTIVLRALAKEPARRYQSAGEMLRDVEHWLHDEPIEARRDSAMSMLRTQARKALRRQKALAMVAAIAIAWVFGIGAADVFNRVWPGPAVWYERAALALTPTTRDSTAFANTRVIAVTDDTEAALTRMGELAKLEGVTSDNWLSSRRLHGWMMQRLADADVRGVVWDFGYARDSEFDADYAAGVQALREHNAGAAVGINTWELNERGEPAVISRNILDSGVLWGCVALQFPDANTAKMHLIAQHPGRVPTLSLPLAALSIWTNPGAEPMPELDLGGARVILRFREPKTTVMQAMPDPTEYVTLTGVRQPRPFKDEDAADGLDPESWIGDYVVRLPDDQALDAITRTYHEIAAMDKPDFDKWARGRLIIVGDFRTDGEGRFIDRHQSADGQREMFGSHLHAAAIDSLIENARPARYPREGWYRAVVALCAAVGAVLALTVCGSRTRRFTLLVIAVAGVIGVCLLSCRFSGYLCNPTGLVLAMAAGFMLWLVCEPLSHSRTDASTYTSRSATP